MEDIGCEVPGSGFGIEIVRHEDGASAGGNSSFDIGFHVADHVGPAQVDLMRVAGAEEHSGGWFAAGAAIAWLMFTDIDAVER